MAKTYVLDRVAADLAHGFTHPAIQRLSSLVAAYPTDLDLRRRLASVHRRVGNRIQAGRWDYLTVGADSADTLAFERAFPSAVVRLREVRWPHRASMAATGYARTRLARLVAAAEEERASVAAARTARPARGARTGGGNDGSGGGSARLTDSAPTGLGRLARAAVDTGRAIRLRAPAGRRLRLLGRSGRFTVVMIAVAATTALFVAIGAVTVLQWIV